MAPGLGSPARPGAASEEWGSGRQPRNAEALTTGHMEPGHKGCHHWASEKSPSEVEALE